MNLRRYITHTYNYMYVLLLLFKCTNYVVYFAIYTSVTHSGLKPFQSQRHSLTLNAVVAEWEPVD